MIKYTVLRKMFELNSSEVPKVYDSISWKLIDQMDLIVLIWNVKEKEEL